ncbi:hypothetical protein CHELA20_50659 [Hyphomicrobiales bacterium]|nr:hypothetical protein CHELA20_50659 [Hyphomicrobiales bacterium]CAH1677209.1 hypothetical protein CHELA41_24362 [Hyphomicrobiales bacterium]
MLFLNLENIYIPQRISLHKLNSFNDNIIAKIVLKFVLINS